MGATYSAELGDASLSQCLRQDLEHFAHRLAADDETLSEVHVPNHGLGDEGIRNGTGAVANSTHLRSLDLAYNGVTADGVAALTSMLSQHPVGASLLELRLSGNAIGKQGCKHVCEWIDSMGSSCSLKSLYLYQCGLDDEAVLLLANTLQRQQSITALNLDMNHFTRKSAIMLAQALKHNTSLARLSFDSAYNIGSFPEATMAEIGAALEANAERVEHREYIEAVKAKKAERRRAQEEAEKAARDAALAEERRRVEEELSALEELKHKEDDEVRAIEAKMAEAEAKRILQQQKLKDARQGAQERAIESAYQWRDKLTGEGTLVKEWRAGFTILKTAPGQVGGTPSEASSYPERRLKACFCDPDSGTAPYAKKLHYHCKWEDLAKQEEEVIRAKTSTNFPGAKSTSKNKSAGGLKDGYKGCLCSGHICSSVGFMGTTERPDRSTAHFFASAHPGAAPIDLHPAS